jgi:hypothetical protein
MGTAYALGCPACPRTFVVSEVDPDCTLSDLIEHLFTSHAGYNRRKAMTMLADARELSEGQVASDMCGSVEPHLAAMCALTRHSGNRHQGPEGEWQTWTS